MAGSIGKYDAEGRNVAKTGNSAHNTYVKDDFWNRTKAEWNNIVNQFNGTKDQHQYFLDGNFDTGSGKSPSISMQELYGSAPSRPSGSSSGTQSSGKAGRKDETQNSGKSDFEKASETQSEIIKKHKSTNFNFSLDTDYSELSKEETKQLIEAYKTMDLVASDRMIKRLEGHLAHLDGTRNPDTDKVVGDAVNGAKEKYSNLKGEDKEVAAWKDATELLKKASTNQGGSWSSGSIDVTKLSLDEAANLKAALDAYCEDSESHYVDSDMVKAQKEITKYLEYEVNI